MQSGNDAANVIVSAADTLKEEEKGELFELALTSSNCFVRSISTSSGAAAAAPQSVVSGVNQSQHYGPRMRLFCRTGYVLQIRDNGQVAADAYGADPQDVLEFSSAALGEVRIKGVRSNLYLAMNSKGKLYGEEDPRETSTIFVEGLLGQYNTYLSQKYAHKGWYVAIKKNGNIKRPQEAKWPQKAIQFLPVRMPLPSTTAAAPLTSSALFRSIDRTNY